MRPPTSLNSFAIFRALAPGAPFRRFAHELLASKVGAKVSPGAPGRASLPYPCQVAFPEAWVLRPTSRRRSARSAFVTRTKGLTNCLTVLFSYIDLGCPRTPENCRLALRAFDGAAPLTPTQQHFANNLLEEVSSFCRTESCLSWTSRGVAQFSQYLEAMCNSM